MNDPTRLPVQASSHGSPRMSRRGVLFGGAAVVLAAAGGVAAGASRPISHDEPTGRPPTDLVSALAAEGALIAAIDATTGGDAGVRTALRQVRADHVAHRAALQSAVDAYPQPPAGAGPTGEPARALDVPGLRAAEQRASTRAAARAARLSGRDAVLLASVAASEAGHAELFR